jgi:predicted peptidase
MKWFLITILLPVTCSVSLGQQTSPVILTLDPQFQEQTRCLNPEYLAFMPEAASATNLPLLIYLHGAGGTGNDIHRIKRQPKRVLDGIKKFNKGPCIVVAPQCLKQKQGTWFPEDLDLLLQDIQKNLSIDSRRIYLTGNSMGGYGTWAWGAHSPQHFAALAPVVGGIGPGGPKDVTPDLEKWAARLATVPVYAFAGANDKVVPAERSERMIKAIQAAGGKEARLKVYPDKGHDAGRTAFASAEFYDWMFSKSAKPLQLK